MDNGTDPQREKSILEEELRDLRRDMKKQCEYTKLAIGERDEWKGRAEKSTSLLRRWLDAAPFPNVGTIPPDLWDDLKRKSIELQQSAALDAGREGEG